jgi:hypothetical protein
LSEKCNAFLRSLKNKGFKEERVTTMRLDDLGQSTTLESNKSLIRFDLQASDHDTAVTSDRLDMEMIRQGLEALDQKVQQPLEAHADSPTNTAQGNPFHQQAFDERACILRDEILFAAVDKLPSAVVALMVLFAVVNVPVFLVLGGLTLRADISDDHGVLLTSAGWVSVLVNHSTALSGQHDMKCTTAQFS